MREKILLEILEEVPHPEGPREELLESHEIADRATGLQLARGRLAALAGRKVRARIHRHRHGPNGENRPCSVEPVLESGETATDIAQTRKQE